MNTKIQCYCKKCEHYDGGICRRDSIIISIDGVCVDSPEEDPE